MSAPEFLSAAVYRDSCASMWIARLELPDYGESFYLGSNDGRRFVELLELGKKSKGGVSITGLEAVGAGHLRFEVEGGTARLFKVGKPDDALIAGAMALVGQDEFQRVMGQLRFRRIDHQIIRQRVLNGDPDAILAYTKTSRYQDIFPEIPETILANLGKAAMRNDRALFALCKLADIYHGSAPRAVRQLPNERLEPAGRYYESAVRELFNRAKEGDTAALRALGRLAQSVEYALERILLLYDTWEVQAAAKILRMMPIDERELRPSALEIFVKAGHPSAEQKLETMSSQKYVDGARKNRRARDVLDCDDVRQLGILVRHNNAGARGGLLRLYTERHLVAREMVSELIRDGVIERESVQAAGPHHLRTTPRPTSGVVIPFDRFRN